MKIALLQTNASLARPEANGKALEAMYAEAVGRGAELVVSPELAVPGYIPGDRLLELGIMRRIEAEGDRLRGLAGSVPLVFGTCSPAGPGKLWNELWWCERGRLRSVARKRAPAFAGADGRYFEPWADQQETIAHLGKNVILTIGAIGENAHGHLEIPAHAGAALMINAAASTCALGSYAPEGRSPSWALPSKSARRRAFLSNQSKSCCAPVVFVNRVGAEESLLYDGGSCLALPDGTCQTFEAFGDGVFIVDTDAPGTTWTDDGDRRNEGAWLRRALGLGLKDNMSKQGIEGAVIGLSGGIDSAVIAALAAEAVGPKKILGAALPTRYTSAESVELAKAQAQRLGINYLEIDADAPFASALASLACVLPDRRFGITDENTQSRCRGTLLMALTSEPAIHRMLGTDRCAVLNTGNKSEVATGYFTLYGDGIGAFGLLGDLLKARVYALARELGDAIQPEILDRIPTAELSPGQTDEASLMPYRQLDAILGALVEAGRPMEGLGDDLAEVLDGQDLAEARNALPRVERMIAASEFKRRQAPFAIRVTHGSFGSDRNIPLTAV